MREAYPEANAQREIAVQSLEDDFLYGLKTPVTLFLLVAGLVLLLATANVANLLLAQGTSRGREMVVRTALGASRVRIVRQLLTEASLVAILGGVVGVALSAVGIRALASIIPADTPGVPSCQRARQTSMMSASSGSARRKEHPPDSAGMWTGSRRGRRLQRSTLSRWRPP